MKRRNFIHTTGFTLGSLLVLPGVSGKLFSCGRVEVPVLRLPDEVTVITDERNLRLERIKEQTWQDLK
jgi:hypothetical protein